MGKGEEVHRKKKKNPTEGSDEKRVIVFQVHGIVGHRSIHVLKRGGRTHTSAPKTISVPQGNGNHSTKRTGCSMCADTMQMASNCAKLILCSNYSIISLRLPFNTAPPIGDMFIQGPDVREVQKRGMVNEREPFVSCSYSVVLDSLHFKMHYCTHKFGDMLSLRYRVLLALA